MVPSAYAAAYHLATEAEALAQLIDRGCLLSIVRDEVWVLLQQVKSWPLSFWYMEMQGATGGAFQLTIVASLQDQSRDRLPTRQTGSAYDDAQCVFADSEACLTCRLLHESARVASALRTYLVSIARFEARLITMQACFRQTSPTFDS